MRLTYRPPWDTLSIVMTGLSVAFCIVLVYLSATSSTPFWWVYIVLILFVGVVPLFLFPIQETLDPEAKAVTLHFLGYSRTFSVEEYPTLLEGKDYFGEASFRPFSSSGTFGYWGKWKSSDGTTLIPHLMHRSRDVYYITDGDKIVALNLPSDWVDLLYK
jgi:hypothetical protein